MNTRKILAGSALAALASGVALTLAVGGQGAGAAPRTVTAVTHASHHADTTNVATGVSSENGPVWAWDNLAVRFTVTPNGDNAYSVLITDNGSFAGFANPHTGLPDVNNGSVKGTIQYDVTSPNAPDPANLLANQPANPSPSTVAMLGQLFDGEVAIVGGGAYSFTYTRVDGAVYTQTGP
jgi:hypothetical protein